MLAIAIAVVFVAGGVSLVTKNTETAPIATPTISSTPTGSLEPTESTEPTQSVEPTDTGEPSVEPTETETTEPSESPSSNPKPSKTPLPVTGVGGAGWAPLALLLGALVLGLGLAFGRRRAPR